MPGPQHHIIKNQILEMNLPPGHDPFALQKEIRRIYYDRVMPKLEALFDEYAPEDLLIRIPDLEIDLGNLPIQDLEVQMLERMEASLRKELIRHVQADLPGEHSSQSESILPQQASTSALEYYLLHGVLPWTAKREAVFDLQTVMASTLAQNPQSLLQMLRTSGNYAGVRKRLLYNFPSVQNQKIISLLSPNARPLLATWLGELLVLKGERDFPATSEFLRLVKCFPGECISYADSEKDGLRMRRVLLGQYPQKLFESVIKTWLPKASLPIFKLEGEMKKAISQNPSSFRAALKPGKKELEKAVSLYTRGSLLDQVLAETSPVGAKKWLQSMTVILAAKAGMPPQTLWQRLTVIALDSDLALPVLARTMRNEGVDAPPSPGILENPISKLPPPEGKSTPAQPPSEEQSGSQIHPENSSISIGQDDLPATSPEGKHPENSSISIAQDDLPATSPEGKHPENSSISIGQDDLPANSPEGKHPENSSISIGQDDLPATLPEGKHPENSPADPGLPFVEKHPQTESKPSVDADFPSVSPPDVSKVQDETSPELEAKLPQKPPPTADTTLESSPPPTLELVPEDEEVEGDSEAPFIEKMEFPSPKPKDSGQSPSPDLAPPKSEQELPALPPDQPPAPDSNHDLLPKGGHLDVLPSSETKEVRGEAEQVIASPQVDTEPDREGNHNFFSSENENDIAKRFEEFRRLMLEGNPSPGGAIRKPSVKRAASPAPLWRIDKNAEYYVQNAGLVLINPFVAPFFKGLGLVEGRSFVSEEARERGVHLLQMLVTGEAVPHPEFDLMLNKLLCGLDPGQPIAMDFQASEQEMKEAEVLLETVIAHWTALKKVSTAGFRRTFLLREGKLKKKDMGWELSLARATMDILIEKLPWGFATIKMPWNNEFIYVEW